MKKILFWTSVLSLMLLFVLSSTVFGAAVSTIVTEKVQNANPGETVSAFLTPLDEEGIPVSPINTANIKIIKDGKAVDVESVSPVTAPVLVIFVVDVSGTMKGGPIEQSKAAIAQFVEKLKPSDRVCIVAFSDDVTVVHPISPPGDISQSLLLLKAKGKVTELFRALTESLELTNAPKLPKRKIIVAMSDGKDESKSYSDDDVIQKATAYRVPIYSVGFGYKYKAYLTHLERISANTGGVFTEAPDVKSITDVGMIVHQQIMGQIAVSWKRGLGNTKSQEYKVEISKGTFQKTAVVTLPAVKGLGNLLYIAIAVGVLILSIIVFLMIRAGGKKQKMNEAQAELETMRKQQAEEVKRRALAEQDALHARSRADEIKMAVDRMAEQKKRICTTCGKVMLPDWTECLFCKNEANRRLALSRTDVPVYKRARLRFLTGTKKGEVYMLPNNGELTFGAKTGNTLILEDPTLSGNHGKITIYDGKYFLEDLQSTNGTRIDEEMISPNVPHPLSDGNRIRMGRTESIFEGE